MRVWRTSGRQKSHIAEYFDNFKRKKTNLNNIDWYKIVLSITFGLLGFAGSFYSLGVRFDAIRLNFVWSMIFPVCIALVWGKRYGLISMTFGLAFLYPFFLWKYNGWANIVSSFNLILWVVLQGNGTDKRLQKRKFYNNIYFIQMIFALISSALFLIVAMWLYQFNSILWTGQVLKKPSYDLAWIVVIKSAVCDFIIIAICDVLLLFTSVRKFFRLDYKESAKYNARIILPITFVGILTREFFIISVCYVIHKENFSLQQSLVVDPIRLMTLFIEIMLFFIMGGIIARLFQKRHEIETNFQLLWERMSTGFFLAEPVYGRDRRLYDLRIIDANPTMELWAKIRKKDFVGKTRYEIPGIFNGREKYLEHYERVLETGHSVSFEYWHKESDYYWINVFKMGENRVGVMISNISDQKKLEASIKRVSASFEAIVESTDDIIWSVDRDFRLVIMNSTLKKHFKDLANVIIKPGMSPDDVLPGRFAEIWNENYKQVLKKGKYSFDYLTSLGESRFEMSLNPIYKDGEIIEIACFGKDVTEQRRARQEILKLNAELDQRVVQRTAELQQSIDELESFSYTVSHDLKAPLRSIEGYCDFIMEDHSESLEDEVRQMVNVIRKHSLNMIELIGKLLSYSRTSQLKISRESIDLKAMIETVFKESMQSHPQRRVEITIENQLPLVMGDKILIRQVIVNILSNAIKFTSDRDTGRISVGCIWNREEIVFYIKDNGVGFDMEFSHKLFGIFQRLHTSDEFEGSGIGLATVRKIVQIHGGRTWIEGELDKGAAVYFTLPIVV